jgi:Siphovirus Gp157.
MNSLYQISNDYMKVVNDALLSDELSIEQVDLLSKIEGDLEDKAVKIASIIRNLESEAEAVRAAMKEMQERAKRLDNKTDMLSQYLKHNLESCGVKEVRKSPHFVIKIKKNPPSVVLESGKEVPEEFLRTKVVKEANKTLIAEKLKEGIEFDFARLEQVTKLEIK